MYHIVQKTALQFCEKDLISFHFAIFSRFLIVRKFVVAIASKKVSNWIFFQDKKWVLQSLCKASNWQDLTRQMDLKESHRVLTMVLTPQISILIFRQGWVVRISPFGLCSVLSSFLQPLRTFSRVFLFNYMRVCI